MTKKELSQVIEIPEGNNVDIDGANVTVKGSQGEISREFDLGNISLDKKGNEIVVKSKKENKKDKRRMNTIIAHIKNMLKGTGEKFEYKLKVCASHFPITVEVKGHEGIVKNFLGERTPRKVKIPAGAEVNVDRDVITIKASNIEVAGQAAANFENATKIRKRDRRIFQDGIFITSKCGEEI